MLGGELACTLEDHPIPDLALRLAQVLGCHHAVQGRGLYLGGRRDRTRERLPLNGAQI